MAIKSSRAFTIIEVLVSIFIFSLILIGSVKAYTQVLHINKMSEMRYLMLAKIDSEMNRLVFAYDNFPSANFVNRSGDSNSTWNEYFTVPINAGSDDTLRVYENKVLEKNYGMYIMEKVEGELNNVVNIYNQDNNDYLSTHDLVGLLAWRITYDTSHTPNTANISLSITYPYVISAHTISTTVIIEPSLPLMLETINLKTTTSIVN